MQVMMTVAWLVKQINKGILIKISLAAYVILGFMMMAKMSFASLATTHGIIFS